MCKDFIINFKNAKIVLAFKEIHISYYNICYKDGYSQKPYYGFFK